MPELIIKYKGSKTLRALKDFAKYFDFVIEAPKSKKASGSPEEQKAHLPIEFSDNPDITALAGIWNEKDITLNELRKNAWGNRQ